MKKESLAPPFLCISSLKVGLEVHYGYGSRNSVCMSKEKYPSKHINVFASLLVYYVSPLLDHEHSLFLSS